MGGAISKRKQKSDSKQTKEAAAAETGVKAGVTGKIKKADFLKFYLLIEGDSTLGEGVTGSVHKWRHAATGDIVAVKSVRKRGMTVEGIDNLKQEIKLLSMLDHPNIVKIREAFEDEQTITIVMEICSGGELFDNLEKENNYSQQRAATLFKQMVSAVGYCHKMNVAHRDLKLENFVFESRDKDAQLKLIDFGLSNRHQSGGIRRMNTLVGTPYYMAPEVINRNVKYGNECDVWSLGVILFMMLTGTPPFNGYDSLHIMESVRNNDIQYEDRRWDTMPDAKELVLHMLQVNPAKRYTCDQVLKSRWLKRFASKEDAGKQQMISGEVIKSMIAYANMEQLKRTAVQVVAFALAPAEIKKLRDTFKAFDVDGSGTLSLSEFREAMMKNAHMDRKSIADLFAKIDSDHTGLISYSEFISASLSTSVHLNEDRLCAAFDNLDPDASGYIDAHELGTILQGSADQADIDKIIADADHHGDNDGKISREEFSDFVQTH